MSLEKIDYIQNIGFFKELIYPDGELPFSKAMLIFGSNGSGKSTIVDVLRSLSENKKEIMKGRERLGSSGEHKAVVTIDEKQYIFKDGTWDGTYSNIKIFDSTFINENVYSGDSVLFSHLKNQYDLILGRKGIQLVNEMKAIENEISDNNKEIKGKESYIQNILNLFKSSMSIKDFSELEPAEDEISIEISELEKEKNQFLSQGKIKEVSEPIEISFRFGSENFQVVLSKTIDDISNDAKQKILEHIEGHKKHAEGNDSQMQDSHEAWLKSGLEFQGNDNCAFCGQFLKDRSLIDVYEEYFSDEYASLLNKVKGYQIALEKITSGELLQEIENTLDRNEAIFQNWQNLTGTDFPNLPNIIEDWNKLVKVSEFFIQLFRKKQENLVEKIKADNMDENIEKWNEIQDLIAKHNDEIKRYVEAMNQVKNKIPTEDIKTLDERILNLKLKKKKVESDVVQIVAEWKKLTNENSLLDCSLSTKRKEFEDHMKSITENLTEKINEYLKDFGANFTIDYKKSNFKGDEPSANYNISINKHPFQPRCKNDVVGIPNFRNTLSAGDKSTLALALFMSSMSSDDDLSEQIIVMDDPFTSLDSNRRRRTINAINEIYGQVKQVIIFSHDKIFLRKLRNAINRSEGNDNDIKYTEMNDRPNKCARLVFSNIIEKTEFEARKRVRKIIDFIENPNNEADPSDIGKLLRPTLEHYFRFVAPNYFKDDIMLGGIIKKINKNNIPVDKDLIKDLDDMRDYTNDFHHDEGADNDIADGYIDEQELRGYCERVIKMITIERFSQSPAESV